MSVGSPEGQKVLSCDLHIHSALSPCAENRMVPKFVVQKLLTLNIDVFSITDHNSCFNCKAFEKVAGKHGLVFIPGIELQSAEEIHLLGYFSDVNQISDFCAEVVDPARIFFKNDPDRFGSQIKIDENGRNVGEEECLLTLALKLGVDDLVQKIHWYGGVAVPAHLDRSFSVISQLGYIPPDLAVDAVEIWDALKIDEIKKTFLQGRDLNVLSSSDSHYLDMMKKSKMKFVVNEKNVDACLSCITGEGDSRITVTVPRGKSSNRFDSSIVGSQDNSDARDWRNLYK